MDTLTGYISDMRRIPVTYLLMRFFLIIILLLSSGGLFLNLEESFRSWKISPKFFGWMSAFLFIILLLYLHEYTLPFVVGD